MDKLFGTVEHLETVQKLLEVVNFSTNDYMFIWDIKQDINRFFGDVDSDFEVRKPGCETNRTEEMLRIIHPADRAAVSADLAMIASGEKLIHDMSYRWIDKSGKTVWVNCRGRVINDDNGDPSLLIGRVSKNAMRHLYNSLTGLFNKTKLREDLESKLTKNSGRYLMLLDIDNFAAINLSHGRDFGDELLTETAALLEGKAEIEQAYHTDSNIFAAVIKADSIDTVGSLFSEIGEAFKEKCTFTAGAVPIDRDIFIDVGHLMDSANVTLKKAKNGAANHLEFFSADEIKQRVESLTLLEELKDSIACGFEGFELNYQPQVKGGSYELFGVEALLRYTSKTRGRVFPDEFIPLLEQSRLILDVGMWVLETALTQVKEWRVKLPDLRMSVNYSTVQFEDSLVGEKTVNCLKKLGLPGDALIVELTESLQLYSSEQISNGLKYLKKFGIHIAIDDFGTGYSNLGYLKQLDANEIKIDRSFVGGIEKDTYNYKLISNVVEFAKTNTINVCCEGVETDRELAILEILHPDKIQGYLFDKPRTAAEIEQKYINTSADEYKKRTDFIESIYKYREAVGSVHFDPSDILRENDVGLWVIRIDEKRERFEMHTDETMERILGLERKCLPSECYMHWYTRIAPACKGYVRDSVDTMISCGKTVQLKYQWNHPTMGEVTVRCSGKRVKDDDGMIVLEGYHRILSDALEI